MYEPRAEEIRAVDLNRMLAWYRGHVEQTSLRQVARWCGVGHSTLHNVLSGARPHPRIRRSLALAYLLERGKATPGLPVPLPEIQGPDEPHQPDQPDLVYVAHDTETAALETLLGPLPSAPRALARRMILCILAGIYVEADRDVPLWIISGRDSKS